jgi:hypothetical protein
MTVNRSIFAFIKKPSLLVFLGGFIAAFSGCVVYSLGTTPLKYQCAMPVSLYAIKDENSVVLTRGIYRSFRSGLETGRITFVGSITHFVDGKQSALPTPVMREVMVKTSFTDNLLFMTVTAQHRRLGDQSSDRDVQDYIFPQIHPGDTNTTSLYLLDGKVIATGSETVARTACIN